MPDDPSTSIEAHGEPEQTAYCPYTAYEQTGDDSDLPATGESARGRKRSVWDALSEVEDPEMPISVVDLGLIYGVEIDDDHVLVEMTLTYTGCPARTMLLSDVQSAVEAVDTVEDCDVRLVWTPEWSIEFITEDGANALEAFGVSVP
ncbi:1,2-phenylacetyl-CoA epoxidase subunit PaaD [Halocatena pleomorpha]|uniref:Metal-sulfur cluster assembly factor n=1 Tax=Halocatena pleomorpha TaxID=1785090 RepID=A0A3P3R7V0_9EURY|nr:1,2-phenylacetyl-CoA epoxidase subunit PaaD [Halocatena pleomorpha]RRJ29118.1 metal-sulfur cluster assembly factor [Halocatena pleomorpha]